MTKLLAVIITLLLCLQIIAIKTPVYALVYDSDPGLVIIRQQVSYGTGYLTTDSQLYTLHHVLVPPLVFPWWLKLQTIDSSQFQFTTSDAPLYVNNFECQLSMIWDGPCSALSKPGNIMRDPYYQFTQLAFYHSELQAWMFYKLVKKETVGYIIEGLMMDSDEDGVADFQAYVCRGMSGSPAIVAFNGQLVLHDGHLISIGELQGARGDIKQIDGRECTSTALVIS